MIYAWMFNNEGKIANMFKKFKANEKYSTKIVLSPDLTYFKHCLWYTCIDVSLGN